MAFHEQRDVVADWSALESGVLLNHDAFDFGWFDLLVLRDKSAENLVDDLLFSQRDHANQYAQCRRSCQPAGWPLDGLRAVAHVRYLCPTTSHNQSGPSASSNSLVSLLR
jgi:hypothetical protein